MTQQAGIATHHQHDHGRVGTREMLRIAGRTAHGIASAARFTDAAANAAAPVRVITGGNFDADVVASGADVLLEIYAPWCGHCKALAPKYDALGAAVKAAGLDKLYIAKMDGTANEIDHPGVDVQARAAARAAARGNA